MLSNAVQCPDTETKKEPQCQRCNSKLLIYYPKFIICGRCDYKLPAINSMLEQYFNWKVSGHDSSYSNHNPINMIARMMNIMRSPKCPKCRGSGKRKHVYFAKNGRMVICGFCQGKGKIRMDRNDGKVNPGLIRGTGYVINMPDDPQSEKIDRIIAKHLNNRDQMVLELEYNTPGSQDDKAVRLRMHVRTYCRRLARSKDVILAHL